MKVRQRNSVPCSLSPEGPNGRAHMKKDLPGEGVSQMDHDGDAGRKEYGYGYRGERNKQEE